MIVRHRVSSVSTRTIRNEWMAGENTPRPFFLQVMGLKARCADPSRFRMVFSLEFQLRVKLQIAQYGLEARCGIAAELEINFRRQPDLFDIDPLVFGMSLGDVSRTEHEGGNSRCGNA